MTSGQMLTEIREANLIYLALAQKLIEHDREQATVQLGVSSESAELISLLSPQQVLRIAAGNMLLCRFRVDDDLIWNLITDHTGPSAQFAERSARIASTPGTTLLTDAI